jgi:hypothetical protein
MKTIMLILLLSSTAALAQQVTTDAPAHASVEVTIDQDVKTWALKRAYQLNGNSMVGFGRSIDLTDEVKSMISPQEFNVLDATAAPVPAEPLATNDLPCTKHRRGKCRK